MKNWSLFVHYCNEGERFQELVESSLVWIGGMASDIESCADIENGREIDELAEQYRPAAKKILRWLTNPKDKLLGRKCLAFIKEHGTQIKIDWTRVNFGPKDLDMMFIEYPVEIGSVITPICKFLKDQIDLYAETDCTFLKAFPVAACKRPRCGRFTIVKKMPKGGVLCSLECKAKWRKRMMSKKRKKEYMRTHRKIIDRHRPKETGSAD